MIKSIKEERVGERMAGCMKNEKEKVHRQEGGYLRERGEENAWRSEKGGEEGDKVYSTHERERNINGVEMGRGLRGENSSALDRRVEYNMYSHI